MVLLVAADVNEIARLGRNFPWVKPPCCPSCSQSLWWHGFVPAYVSSLVEAILLRRLRCGWCGAVHRLKPRDYWRSFRCRATEIEHCVAYRTTAGRWFPGQPRDRQRQWWRRLRRLTTAVLGLDFTGSPLEAFRVLAGQGFIPVSTSLYRENPGTGPPPYRSVLLP